MTDTKSAPGLFRRVLTVSAVLLLLYVALGAPQQLGSKIEISDLREELLFWNGLANPVGVRLTVTVAHPRGMNVSLPPPQVIMGEFDSERPPAPFYQKPYYTIAAEHVDSQLSMLKATTQAPSTNDPKRFDADSETSTFVYELYPGTIFRVEGTRSFCLHSSQAGTGSMAQHIMPEMPDLFHSGENLSAYWVGVNANQDVAFDLSSKLTKALRRTSYFQGRPDRWQSLQMIFAPNELRKDSIYRRVVWRGHEVCFTRDAPDASTPPYRWIGSSMKEAETFDAAELSVDTQIAELRNAVENGDTHTVLLTLGKLQRLGPNAAKALPTLTGLLINHAAFCDVVSSTIALIGPEAIQWLLPYANDPNPETRRRVIEALGKIQPHSPDAVVALVAALDDSDVSVRRFAAFAMSDISDYPQSPVPKLKKIALDDAVPVRHAAVTALGNFGTEGVPVLIEALQSDKNKSVRIGAVRSLLRLGHLARSSAPALQNALKDSDQYVRMYAERALRELNMTPNLETVSEAALENQVPSAAAEVEQNSGDSRAQLTGSPSTGQP